MGFSGVDTGFLDLTRNFEGLTWEFWGSDRILGGFDMEFVGLTEFRSSDVEFEGLTQNLGGLTHNSGV